MNSKGNSVIWREDVYHTFNFSGDSNRFANTDIEWIDVTLTQPQRQSVEKCFKEHSNLKFNPKTGQWLPNKGNEIKLKKGKTARNLSQCVTSRYIYPYVTNMRAKTKPGQTDLLPKNNSTAALSQLYKQSTAMFELVKNFQRSKRDSRILLDDLYDEEDEIPEKPLNYLKQMIFTDNAKAEYGVYAIASALESIGMTNITRQKSDGKVSIKENPNTKKYTKFIVLSKAWATETNKNKLTYLIKRFNAPEKCRWT